MHDDFEEKKSGTRRNGRTELQVLLECVREGDTVIVTRIDRLARSMKDLQDIVHELKEKGVSLKGNGATYRHRERRRKGVPGDARCVRGVRDEFAPRAAA